MISKLIVILTNTSFLIHVLHTKKGNKRFTRQYTSKWKPRDDHHTNENVTVKIVTEAITFSDTSLLSSVPLFPREKV